MKKLNVKNNFTKSNQKGITLIALIVTIIVLIIIAGISIATLTADNGVLRQTNLAKIAQIEGTAREQVKLATSAMRLAVAEARAQDNSYSAIAHSSDIQAKLLDMIKNDNTGLKKEGWGTEAEVNDNVETFTITYAGADYRQACNNDQATITYTIKLGQSAIEITNEVNATLKDQNQNDVEIDIGGNDNTGGGNGTGSGGGSGGGSGSGGSGGSGSGSEEQTMAAGLYETGSNYTVLLKSWEDLLAEGWVKVDNNAVSVGTVLPDNMPEKNEYGFYYGVAYTMSTSGEDIVFKDDASFDVYYFGELVAELPAGAIAYSDGSIDMSAFSFGIGTVSADGTTIVFDTGLILTMGNPVTLDGDLLLPNDGTIKMIGSFANNTELTGVVIPDSVTFIGAWAFANCWSLANVTFEGTVAQWNAIIKGEGWNDGSPIACVQCSDGTIQYAIPGLYETGTNYTVLLKSWTDLLAEGTVHVEDGVVYTNVDMNTWENASADALAGDLMLPNSIIAFGDYAFQWCDKLTAIAIPDRVTTIDNNAFYGCTSLASVTFGENSQLTTIGGNAFAECAAITSIGPVGSGASVEIPDSVTDIEFSAFQYCTNLTSVTFSENSKFKYISYYVFSGCTALTSVTIPDVVTTIYDQAFENCTKLTNITFKGTMVQWNAITKGSKWNYNVPATTVTCSNGTVTLN